MTPARFIAPMKALGSSQIPTGIWQCEVKFDGYRAVGVLNGGNAELWSRNRKALSDDFPEVVAELGGLRCDNAVIDGEIVALDGSGRSRFQLLQHRGRDGDGADIVYFVFDLMQLDGKSLENLPLRERRKKLVSFVGKRGGRIRLSPAFDVEPSELFAAARKNGLEGVIAKRPDSAYEPDRRSGAWIKCKVFAEQEFVVGGFTPPQRSRQHFGAILVGYFDRNKLIYAGKVGTGFDVALLKELHAQFMRLRREKCPFDDLPQARKPRFGKGMGPTEMKSVTWLKPSLVAQIRFAEWTDEGLLRQPVFLGLRSDKAPKAVRREVGPIPKGRLPQKR